MKVWQDPIIPLRMPKLMDPRADPFERAEGEAGAYERWRIERAFAFVPAQAYVAEHLKTYVDHLVRKPEVSRWIRYCLSYLMLDQASVETRCIGQMAPVKSRCCLTVARMNFKPVS